MRKSIAEIGRDAPRGIIDIPGVGRVRMEQIDQRIRQQGAKRNAGADGIKERDIRLEIGDQGRDMRFHFRMLLIVFPEIFGV